MAGIDVSAINKFNEQNYSQWKFQIVCTLKAKGVFSIANVIKVRPNRDEVKIEKWEEDDAVAIFTI